MANWKAPVLDDVHGYCIKMLVSMHERIAFHLLSCITRGEESGWITTNRTVLLFIKRPSERKWEVTGQSLVYHLCGNCLQVLWWRRCRII